jgi:hypothetical protein
MVFQYSLRRITVVRVVEGYLFIVVTIVIFTVIMLAIRNAFLREGSMAFEVFISYSHKDRKFRDELATHLSNLRNQGVISDWYDGDIPPGTEWKTQIMDHLKTAQVILLLISADFMASNFCYGIELKESIARHDANQARVLPVVLRPTDWEGAPFAKLQMLPSDARPISAWSSRDAAFLDVIAGIKRAIQDLNAGKGTTPNP